MILSTTNSRRGMGDVCPAGYFLDSSGVVCLPNGSPDTSTALTVIHSADDPNYSVTVSANGGPAPAAAGVNAKTLAYVIGGAFLFAMVAKK